MPVMTSSVEVGPHENLSTKYFRSELKVVKAVIFLFHGRGGDSLSVQETLGRHIMRDDSVLVVPTAYNSSWYPYRFHEPESVNQPWLDSAIDWIHRQVVEFIEQGVPPSKLLFGGFSQGSCLALEYVLRYPQRYGGVFSLSGGVIGPEGLRAPLKKNALEGTPIFLGCADVDEWIPRAKFDESIQLLKESGGRVESRIYAGLGHNICEDELECVRSMIDRVFSDDC